MSEETPFSKIIRKEIPAEIVYEDEDCLAFKDIHPQAPVHVLLIPKKTISQLSKVEKEDESILGKLMMCVPEVAKQMGLHDYRVVINNGEEAGQTVFHLHLHIIGGRHLQWPPG